MKNKYGKAVIALAATVALNPVVPALALNSDTGNAVESKAEDSQAPIAKFVIDGELVAIEQGGHYNHKISFKFYDAEGHLASYTLNGVKKTMNMNTWSDGNYENIKGYLHVGNGEEGKNELIVSDVAGNSTTYVFYADQTAPVLSQESFQLTPDNSMMAVKKTAVLTVDEAIRCPGDGWTEVEGSNGTKWQKVYTENCKETITVTDLAGNVSDSVLFEAKRIESRAPEATEISYSNNGEWTNQDVTVTIKTNIECKTPDGWERLEKSKKEFYKVFTENKEEKVILTSTAGVESENEVIVNVDKIDKEAPALSLEDISLTPDNYTMATEKTAVLTVDEAIRCPGDGWTEVEGSNGTQWQKVFTETFRDKNFTVTDLAGNTSGSIDFEVKRIENIEPTAEVTYSNNGEETTDPVTVILTTNVECQDMDGWERVPGSEKRNRFQKTYTENTSETVNLVSLSGVQGTARVDVTGIRLTKEVGVRYYDTDKQEYLSDGKVTVDKDADAVLVDQLTDFPQGYELVDSSVASVLIEDGWISIEIQ